jgi:hypothetical protein
MQMAASIVPDEFVGQETEQKSKPRPFKPERVGHPEKLNQSPGVDVLEWYHPRVGARQHKKRERVGHPPLATPTDVWSTLYGEYSSEALNGGQLKMGLYRYQPGQDFGNSMSAFPNGTDPFYNLELLYMLANQQNNQAPPRACVTTDDGLGNRSTSCN